jgi:hypothetical protein
MKRPFLAWAWMVVGMFVPGLHGAHAAVVFTAAQTITSINEVSTEGTTVFAANIGSTANPTVNGVAFSGIIPSGSTLTLPGGYGTISASSPAHNIEHNAGAFTSGNNPYAALDSQYKSLLQSSMWYVNTTGNKTFTFNLQNLVVTRTYFVQLWVNDPRSTGIGRFTTLQGINSVTLNHNSNGAVGSPGEFTTATFTANATTMSFTATGGGNGQPQFNAFQLRDITPLPEPGTALMFGFGTALLFYIRRRRL